MKRLMLGNEAVARGTYEAGVTFISSYPGTPSTEITEFAAKYAEVYAEWAPNEKVAMEAAFGASLAGARAFCAMKHVGLNVAADPLFTASYTGVNGGLVIGVADDQGMHSSQNEQDSRNHAKAAKVLMLEPSDSGECKAFTKEAFELSEQFDTPVLLRLSTRVSHSQSLVEEEERQERPLREYQRDIAKYVMMPAFAKKKHVVVEERQRKLEEYVETSPLNRVEMGGRKIGVICGGIAYEYAREALGDKASYLKLGVVNPLPRKLIADFCREVEQVYVIEELDDVIETHCRKLGLSVLGKELFSYIGEYTAEGIAEKLLGRTVPVKRPDCDIPVRPPVMCPGCPHRGLFYILKKLNLTVCGDIGCYTLGAAAPLSAMDMVLCMGASISGLHGFNKARAGSNRTSVAVIGDSTFAHSGITGLVDIVYNQGNSTVIILDNSITGMTGHQQNPTTGVTLKDQPTTALDLEALCRAIGIRRVRVVDPNDLPEVEKLVREETAVDEPSVIITRRPCALLKCVKPGKPFTIDREKCTGCKMCMKLGCPAISIREGRAQIDQSLCTGCDLCTKVCKFGAILKNA